MLKYVRVILLILIIVINGVSLYLGNPYFKVILYATVIIPCVYYMIIQKRGLTLKYFIIDLSILTFIMSPIILYKLNDMGIINLEIPLQYSLGFVVIVVLLVMSIAFIKKFLGFYL